MHDRLVLKYDQQVVAVVVEKLTSVEWAARLVLRLKKHLLD
jgi:hypothetical protein